jgi:hypothetical protein
MYDYYNAVTWQTMRNYYMRNGNVKIPCSYTASAKLTTY